MSRLDELLAAQAPWASADRHWPLTPFELFMWLDDRPQYPLVYQINLKFAGSIDADAMRDAWRFALARHPLLRATIRQTKNGAEWHAARGGGTELIVLSKQAAEQAGQVSIDLTTSPGLHGWLCETAVGWDVRMLYHHACCDGQGTRLFLQDLVLAYSVFIGSIAEPDPFFSLDVSHLERRAEYGATVGLNESLWRKLKEALQFNFAPLQPAALDKAQENRLARSSASRSTTGFCAERLEPAEVELWQDPQRRQGATLNDMAIAVLFSVLGDWQREHGLRPRDMLRIAVPFDLRSREDERMPAANRFTYTFLNRRLSDCSDWRALLPGVQSEMQFFRQSRFGVEFLDGLKAAAGWPRLLRWGVQRRHCFATAVLTNLSDPSRRLRKRLKVDDDGFMWLGEAQCYEMDILTPPLRPGTRWGLGIFEYAGRLTVTFRYDTTAMSSAAAESILQRYLAVWRSSLAASSAIPGA
ncbi:MAG: hypothetical protein JNM18_24280 [Planctomycetaceae bacterium]|nr:hypothetical protein [Planctomycetaceae bacterium]